MKKFITKNFTLYTLHFTLSALALLLVGCKESGTNKVSATGSIYECLVVSNNAAYDWVKPVMEADMPCMPQMEPYFKVMHVVPSQFDSYLKPTRNILLVDIDSTKYTTLKAKISRDAWSHPQAVYRIQSPSMSAFEAYWVANGESVRDWFVQEEIERQTRFYRASTNKQARQILQRDFHCDLLIPEDYTLIMDTTIHNPQSTIHNPQSTIHNPQSTLPNPQSTIHNPQSTIHLIWCCNNKGPMRRDLIVYAYPYTDKRTFSLDYLCQKRDEVLGQVVTASVPGSYMGTEYRIFPPQYRVLSTIHNPQSTIHHPQSTLHNPQSTIHHPQSTIHNPQSTLHTPHSTIHPYTSELRGLWKIYGGEAMGGPFVSHTVLDEERGQVITAEVFLYAAGQKKRNALRQAEAILYTFTLQQSNE